MSLKLATHTPIWGVFFFSNTSTTKKTSFYREHYFDYRQRPFNTIFFFGNDYIVTKDAVLVKTKQLFASLKKKTRPWYPLYRRRH
jgi:hypothetical protein